MSEHTSATWLIPPGSNSELLLCGLIISGLPSVGVALRWFRRGDPNLNLTSDSVLLQRSGRSRDHGDPTVSTKEAPRCPPCPSNRPVVVCYRRTAAARRRPPSTPPLGRLLPAKASWPPPSPISPPRRAGRR